MKTIELKSHFKKISDKSSVRYGEKRPDLHWTMQGLEPQDFAGMDDKELAKVATLANAQIEAYGRKLILAHNDNWEFDPSDSVSLDAAYQDITSATTRKRKFTKEMLAQCGEFYARYASLIGKDDRAASAGSKVIAQKLQPIAANPDALAVMQKNLLELLEKCSEESSTNIKLSEELEANLDTIEKLVEECDSLMQDDSEDLADSL